MKPKIQDCPWCGQEGVVCEGGVGSESKWFAGCSDYLHCDASGPMKFSQEEAIAAWNRIRLKKERKEE